MVLKEGNIYHVFNQGNNRENIFFSRENYLYFLSKINIYIKPHADILAWCLMPNHFHLMLYIHSDQIIEPINSKDSQPKSTNAESSLVNNNSIQKKRTINESIGILLRSYTRAIQKQKKHTGSLFRKGTKAECVNCTDGITPSFYETSKGTTINWVDAQKQYPKVCFDYIHANPVKAGLVEKEIEWEFSSAVDYYGIRNGKLINFELAKQLGLYS